MIVKKNITKMMANRGKNMDINSGKNTPIKNEIMFNYIKNNNKVTKNIIKNSCKKGEKNTVKNRGKYINNGKFKII